MVMAINIIESSNHEYLNEHNLYLIESIEISHTTFTTCTVGMSFKYLSKRKVQ